MENDQLWQVDEGILARMISVLYIHHAGAFGGASRSLLELINAFPEGEVSPHVIVQKGQVVNILEEMGIPFLKTKGISQFDNTQYGHYRGLRWLLLLRELYYAPFTFAALWRARRVWKDIDIIHVNETPQLLSVILAKLIFRKPVVVHLRSLQYQGSSWRTKLVRGVLSKYADRLIAIDQTVKNSMSGLAYEVIHNGYASVGSVGDELETSPISDISDGGLRFLMVGNILPFKGHSEFVEAANICKKKGLKAHFIIVGGCTRNLAGINGYWMKKLGFAKNLMADIKRYIRDNDLENCVSLYPVTLNIRPFYEHVDVLCFPSHLNAVGRPVLEAAFSHVPSIVAIQTPLEDTFIDGETGLRIQEKSAASLAEAMEYCCSHPAEIKRMGEAAYKLAMKNFDIKTNALRMLELYRRTKLAIDADSPIEQEGAIF